jgi:hypothetical protein
MRQKIGVSIAPQTGSTGLNGQFEISNPTVTKFGKFSYMILMLLTRAGP